MLISVQMIQEFQPGDFLIFQLESGFALLRVLAVDENDGDTIWHVAAYRDFFLDVDMAEQAIAEPANLQLEIPHVALTNRAFESTQVAKLKNVPLTNGEALLISSWSESGGNEISDRSIRLLLGLR